MLGPTPVAAPFAEASTDSAALGNLRISTEDGWPAEGASVGMPNGSALRWASGDGSAGAPALLYAAAYVTSDRWQRATLTVSPPAATGEARRVWVDGARVSNAPVALTRGKHLVMVERLLRGSSAAGALTATLAPEASGGSLAASLDPRHAPSWRELHAVTSVASIAVDPTGARAAMVMRARDAAADRTNTWLEVRDATSGKVLTELAQWLALGAHLVARRAHAGDHRRLRPERRAGTRPLAVGRKREQRHATRAQRVDHKPRRLVAERGVALLSGAGAGGRRLHRRSRVR